MHKTIHMPTIESFCICAPTLDQQPMIARELQGQLAAANDVVARLAEQFREAELLPQRILAAAFGDTE